MIKKVNYVYGADSAQMIEIGKMNCVGAVNTDQIIKIEENDKNYRTLYTTCKSKPVVHVSEPLEYFLNV